MPLRIALFGQAPLAIDCLERLHGAGHDVVTVFAPPDGPRPDALAARANALGLNVIQRRFFQRKDGQPIPRALAEYAALQVDLNVLASMTSFLPTEITDKPRYRSICFHPSLLPRFRGGNALQWQIMLGEQETGVSIFVPDSGVDTGPIVVQRGGVRIESSDTTASLFFDKLAPLGAEALLDAVERIDKGSARLETQDEGLATFQGLVRAEDARIDWSRSGLEVSRQIRGCDPQPGAWSRLGEHTLRLYDVSLQPVRTQSQDSGARKRPQPGEIVEIDTNGLHIALGDAELCVSRVRADVAKETAHAFAERAGVSVGDRLT